MGFCYRKKMLPEFAKHGGKSEVSINRTKDLISALQMSCRRLLVPSEQEYWKEYRNSGSAFFSCMCVCARTRVQSTIFLFYTLNLKKLPNTFLSSATPGSTSCSVCLSLKSVFGILQTPGINTVF